MRQIVLDTETTGLDPALGHRIIDIAGVEIANRRLTGRHFHRYVNPGRESDEAALQIHGLTSEFLGDKPKFADVVDEFLDFVSGAELIIHNAAFDIAFIDYELNLLARECIGTCCASVVDTLQMARDMHPGKRNGLDALCDRYQIDNSARTLHGALLDAELLAEVYLAMTRGQESLIIEEETLQISMEAMHVSRAGLTFKVIAASPEESAAHAAYLAELDKASGGKCLWRGIVRDDAALVAAAM
jgi:DNA polymerase III subunit epsilon